MANQPTKPSLKEKLAEAKNKRVAITKEAKTRVASAWTIAKTMLPTAPDDVKKAFAASLLNNSTKVLKAALRQTAINAHYTKLAETFKEVHKVELNDLLEDPSVLTKEKKAVEGELKSDSKSASKKIADDRKECGPQEGVYDDGLGGRKGFGNDFDASKANERPDAGEKPGQTQNLSDGESPDAKSAAAKSATTKAKKATCDGKNCKGCDECKGIKAASNKKADGEEGEDSVEVPNEEDNLGETPAELPPPVEGDPEVEAADILTDEKKGLLEEKITEAEDAIQSIQKTIFKEKEEDRPDLEGLEGLEGEEEDLGDAEALEDEGEALEDEGEALEDEDLEGEDLEGDELDLDKIFDRDKMDEKAASLANEGDKIGGEEDSFFAPSAAESLEASLDDDGMADMQSMFSMQGADGDPLASLIAGLKTAEEVAGMNVVESFRDSAEHFKQDEATSDDRTNKSDHDGDLWTEAMEDIKPEEQGAKRTPQDSVNELQRPKAAVLKKIRTAAGSDKAPKPFDVGIALFGTDEN